ncbi:hypothetical protein BGW38_008621 [Lunasporangiospora selenospora]|uniref:C3H1-type domain-containing protein n=1 Tax=Lunasporangiospora selenospora TaxID=979761 RepID=A0A9P6G382_9FUNG|nr:hypothetical protein BGW38_008621 [Lunasporangiospora selenospora]
MNMENLIQVRAKELIELIRVGPDNSPLPVIGASASQNSNLQGDAPTTPSALTEAITSPNNNQPPVSKRNSHWNVQPQKRYFVEGRIIHKRKMSKRLFFLDIVLVRQQATKSPLNESWYSPDVGSNGEAKFLQGETLVKQMEADMPRESGLNEPNRSGTKAEAADSVGSSTPCVPMVETKMEIIVRYPAHSLKDIDDLWHRVQLGSIVRVYGDIELAEPKRKAEQPTMIDICLMEEMRVKWTALLHCMDFELLEAWQGKESFEPNPGQAKISSTTIRQSVQQKESQKKPKANHSLDEEQGADASFPNKKPKHENTPDGEILQTHIATTILPEDNAVIRGDASQPHCKFWINSGKCNKTECLFWHETDPVKLRLERKQWVEARIQAKRQISHHASDPHQKTTKNQHRERALYFAQWLLQTFSRDFLNSGTGVLDIAGGRGDLSWELQTRQGIRSTIVEPRPGKEMRKWQRRWLEKFKRENRYLLSQKDFDSPDSSTPTDVELAGQNGLANEGAKVEEDVELDDNKAPEGLDGFIPSKWAYPLQTTEPARIQAMLDGAFQKARPELIESSSILIGLHPDQATEPIVRAALESQKPFAVIPCCVFGSENLHRRLPITSSSADEAKVTEETEDPSATDETDEVDNNGLRTRAVTSYDDFVTWQLC